MRRNLACGLAPRPSPPRLKGALTPAHPAACSWLRMIAMAPVCPRCGQQAPIVYRGVVPYCTACGALRGPLTGPSINMAGQTSQVGGTFATRAGLARAAGRRVRRGRDLLGARLDRPVGLGLAIAGPIALVVLVVGILLVRGGRSLSTSGLHKAQATRDQALLAMAAHKGSVTAEEAGRALGIATADADAMLTDLAKRDPDRVAVDVDDQGVVWYRVAPAPGQPLPRVRVDASGAPPAAVQPPLEDDAVQDPRALRVLHAELDACRACPKMIGPVVHGPPVVSRVLLRRPGARSARGLVRAPLRVDGGRTMFRWFEESLGIDEATFRARVVHGRGRALLSRQGEAGAAIAGPTPRRSRACKTWLEREVAILRPELVVAVGTLAIEQVLGEKSPLADVVGTARRARWHGCDVDVVALPHPSGASPWHKTRAGQDVAGQGAAPARAAPGDAGRRRMTRLSSPSCHASAPPTLTRRLMGSAAATVDRALVAAMQMRNRGVRARAEAFPHDERLRRLELVRDAYGAPELISAPTRTSCRRPPSARASARVRALPWGGECLEASWPSTFKPYDAGVRDGTWRTCRTATAHARLYVGAAPAAGRDCRARLHVWPLGDRRAGVAHPLAEPSRPRRCRRGFALPWRARASLEAALRRSRARIRAHQRGLPSGRRRPSRARRPSCGPRRAARRRHGDEPRRLHYCAPRDARGGPGVRRAAHPARVARRLRARSGAARQAARGAAARRARGRQPRREPVRAPQPRRARARRGRRRRGGSDHADRPRGAACRPLRRAPAARAGRAHRAGLEARGVPGGAADARGQRRA